MGALFFFDETVSLDNNKSVDCSSCQVEVLDNHGIPEIRIGPEGDAWAGYRATFNDWKQFERFVDAVNDTRSRLLPISKDR